MKRLIIFLSLCLCLSVARAQTADERVGQLLNTSDWFALEREYPALRDSVHVPFLRVMAEALAAVYFGRDDEAVKAIDDLIANHQQEIGFDNTKNMVLIQAQTEARRQRYAKAAEIVGNFVSQVKAQTDQADLSQPETALRLYGIRSKLPPSTLERPACDVAVEAEFREVDLSALGDTAKRGYTLCIPASVNGHGCRAVLDTGCPTTFCSLDYARNVGARLLPDTIDEEVDIVRRRVESFEKVMELPAEKPALEEIRRVVTIFRELRQGATNDGKTKLKSPSGTLSTAEAISVVNNGLAMAGYFGDGQIHAEDLVSGILGAVVKDPVQDKVVWQEYMETVVKNRDGWKDIYRASRDMI